MLGSKKTTSLSGGTTLMAHETVVVGDIHFFGNLDIEGLVQGNVIAQPGKEALLRVVGKGRVEGGIRVPGVVINGAVQGDVYSSKHLELAPKSKVKGIYVTPWWKWQLVRRSMAALLTTRMPRLNGIPPAQMPKRTALTPDLRRKADRTLNLTKLVGLKIMLVENHVKRPLSALEYTDVSC